MRRVDFDPDGTDESYLGLVVQFASGVLYCQQCGGTGTEQREVEGYFVPLSGVRFGSEGRIGPADLTAVFHRGKRCLWGTPSADQLHRLTSLVADMAYWDVGGNRTRLQLDQSRLEEVREAWVPVLTPDGPAILTWPNCD